MKVYVASSWRNALQPSVVQVLREEGHDVYDFRNPPGGTGFSWRQVTPDDEGAPEPGERCFTDADAYRGLVSHPRAKEGYQEDLAALKGCDALVYVLPCGRSASWEFGYAFAAGKPCYVVWVGVHEPELMFREATVLGSLGGLREAFKGNP